METRGRLFVLAPEAFLAHPARFHCRGRQLEGPTAFSMRHAAVEAGGCHDIVGMRLRGMCCGMAAFRRSRVERARVRDANLSTPIAPVFCTAGTPAPC